MPVRPESTGRRLWGMCLARVGGGMVFMTLAATLTTVRQAWDLSAAQGGSLITGFNLAYAFSLVGLSSLADRLGAKQVFLGSMTAGAALAAAFAFLARDYYSALILYTLLGAAMGGTYTTGLMILSDLFPVNKRGLVMGLFIAATSLGYALSMWVSGLALSADGYRLAFMLTSIGPVLGAGFAWFALWGYTTPPPPPTRAQGFRTEVLRNRPAMLLIGGYTMHNWELLGMWAWSPAFLAVCFAAAGSGQAEAASLGSYLGGLFHITGLSASFAVGWVSDRLGRARTLVGVAFFGAACSFGFGWSLGLPLLLVVAVGLAYAFLALGDSPVLSAALSEEVAPQRLGAAFGLRSLLGFGAGSISPLALGAVLDAVGQERAMAWGMGFGLLGLGGLGAALCALAYRRRLQKAQRIPE